MNDYRPETALYQFRHVPYAPPQPTWRPCELIFQHQDWLRFCRRNKLRRGQVFTDLDGTLPIELRPALAQLFWAVENHSFHKVCVGGLQYISEDPDEAECVAMALESSGIEVIPMNGMYEMPLEYRLPAEHADES